MCILEVYVNRNDKKLSYTIKLFSWKYFLNVILPVLSTVYLYFFGKYDDFTSAWINDTGVDLILTSFFRIFALMFVGLFRYFRSST
jgi:hypothetical protein